MNITAQIADMTLKSWCAFLTPRQIQRNARVVNRKTPANAFRPSPFSAAATQQPHLQPAAAAQALSVEQANPFQAGGLVKGQANDPHQEPASQNTGHPALSSD